MGVADTGDFGTAKVIRASFVFDADAEQVATALLNGEIPEIPDAPARDSGQPPDAAR